MYAFSPLGSMLGKGFDARMQANLQVSKHVSRRDRAYFESQILISQKIAEERMKPSKPLEIATTTDKEFSGRVQESTMPHVYASQQERTIVEVTAHVSNDLLAREISGSIRMRNSWDYSIDSNNYIDKAINELQVKLNQKVRLEGKFSNLLNALKDKWSSNELARLEDALNKYKEKIYCGYQVLTDAGPYGGVNYEILNILSEKKMKGDILTAEESEIYSLGSLLMGSPSLEGSPSYYGWATSLLSRRYRQSYRRDLLIELLSMDPILSDIRSDTDSKTIGVLSALFFGDSSLDLHNQYNHLEKVFLCDLGTHDSSSKPYISGIWSIIFNVLSWSEQTFKSLRIDIPSDLGSLKGWIINRINEWILNSEGYTYISPKWNSRFNRFESFVLQYEMVQNI